MPIRDVAAQNASLDNDYGEDSGPSSPVMHTLALYDADPREDGAEVTGPGYARGTVVSWDWLPATDGYKTTTAPIPVGPPTGEWVPATWWALLDGTTMWDCGPLTETLLVTDAGDPPLVTVAVFYGDAVADAPLE